MIMVIGDLLDEDLWLNGSGGMVLRLGEVNFRCRA